MASLTEVYTGSGAEVSEQRLLLGAGLFALGVALAILGVLAGTTDLLAGLGYGIYESRRIAGVLSGFGVPTVFLGIATVLPAARRVRALATVGTALAACGVFWFWSAYPADWAGYGRDLTLPVTACYLLGTTLTFGCLFVGVARFKTRNDPGGTVSLDVIRKGETRIVEVDRSVGTSSVGLIGDTNVSPPPRNDGGTESALQSPSSSSPVDRYCGNCAHVEYVRTEGDIRPYCTHHDRHLETMDACEKWTPNTPERGANRPPEKGANRPDE